MAGNPNDMYRNNPYGQGYAAGQKSNRSPDPLVGGGLTIEERLQMPNIISQAGSGKWSTDSYGNPTYTETLNDNLTAAANSGDAITRDRAAAAESIAGGLGDWYSNPMDWSQFGELGTGDDARQQAIDAAYAQATSRLDPTWSNREADLRSRLYSQGLREGDEAYQREMDNLNRYRNDAYTSAMSSAIGQGTQAGTATFNQNLQSRQQAIIEALRQRGMPLEEINSLMGQGG